jgi:hypothetical protein
MKIMETGASHIPSSAVAPHQRAMLQRIGGDHVILLLNEWVDIVEPFAILASRDMHFREYNICVGDRLRLTRRGNVETASLIERT